MFFDYCYCFVKLFLKAILTKKKKVYLYLSTNTFGGWGGHNTF